MLYMILKLNSIYKIISILLLLVTTILPVSALTLYDDSPSRNSVLVRNISVPFSDGTTGYVSEMLFIYGGYATFNLKDKSTGVWYFQLHINRAPNNLFAYPNYRIWDIEENVNVNYRQYPTDPFGDIVLLMKITKADEVLVYVNDGLVSNLTVPGISLNKNLQIITTTGGISVGDVVVSQEESNYKFFDMDELLRRIEAIEKRLGI